MSKQAFFTAKERWLSFENFTINLIWLNLHGFEKRLYVSFCIDIKVS